MLIDVIYVDAETDGNFEIAFFYSQAWLNIYKKDTSQIQANNFQKGNISNFDNKYTKNSLIFMVATN